MTLRASAPTLSQLSRLLQASGTGGTAAAAAFADSSPVAAGASSCSMCSGPDSNMAETLVLYAMGKLAAKLDR